MLSSLFLSLFLFRPYFSILLDASTQLCKRVRPSVRPSIRPTHQVEFLRNAISMMVLNKRAKHCGTKPGRFETSNYSLFHEIGSE